MAACRRRGPRGLRSSPPRPGMFHQCNPHHLCRRGVALAPPTACMAEVFVSRLEWSGSAKGATLDASTFSRDLDVRLGSIPLPMSAAPSFRGDPSRLNPEQLFVASLSACQALTYLFL